MKINNFYFCYHKSIDVNYIYKFFNLNCFLTKNENNIPLLAFFYAFFLQNKSKNRRK